MGMGQRKDDPSPFKQIQSHTYESKNINNPWRHHRQAL